MTDEPKAAGRAAWGVPDVTRRSTAFREYCMRWRLAWALAADAERASGFRYGHEDWLVQFKRDGAGIGLA